MSHWLAGLDTVFSIVFGALLSLLATIVIEHQKKPKLVFEIEDPPCDMTYPGIPVRPAREARFVRVIVYNKPVPRIFRWLGRSPAYQCTGNIQFHHFEDGGIIFSEKMAVRWAKSDEPSSPRILPDGQVEWILDPVKYYAVARRDCFPGTPEPIDVAARFDNDDDCFGWSQDSYVEGKGWRNQDFKLPKGRYLVNVTIRSSGEEKGVVFRLENSVGRRDFRLVHASKAEIVKVRKSSE